MLAMTTLTTHCPACSCSSCAAREQVEDDQAQVCDMAMVALAPNLPQNWTPQRGDWREKNPGLWADCQTLPRSSKYCSGVSSSFTALTVEVIYSQ